MRKVSLVSLLFMSSLFGKLVFAGQAIKQSVKVSQENGATFVERHMWYLDDRKFRLSIDRENRKIDYIYTGRSLFACLKTDLKKIATKISADKGLEESLKKGVCVVTPDNIMASFLMSPYHAISFVNVSKSLKVTIEVDSYSIEKTPGTKALKGLSCQNVKRKFFYRYKSDDNKSSTNEGEESTCVTSDLQWRKTYARDVMRRLLRHKGSQDLRQKIKSYKLDKLGLVLEGQSKFSGQIGKSPKSTYTMNFKTEELESAIIHRRYFKVPRGYEVISGFGKRDPGEIASKQKSDAKDAKEKEDLGSTVDPRIFIRMIAPFL